MFEFDGDNWRELPGPPAASLASNEHLVINDICSSADRTLWAAGFVVRLDEQGHWGERRGYLARLSEGRWTVATPPKPPITHVAWEALDILQCEPDSIWLLNNAIHDPTCLSGWTCAGSPVLTGGTIDNWTYVTSLPQPSTAPIEEARTRYPLLAAAIDPTGALWISYASNYRVGATEPLHRWDGTKWTSYELPSVPDARYYDVHAIAFDQDGTGWAISNLSGGAARGTNHGILLRFDGARWQLQNWTYSPLRVRWFGLFG